MIRRLVIAYRGDGYAGWQRQANAVSVQEILEQALAELLGSPIRLEGASRTDRGVHARGQCAHFELDRPVDSHALVAGTNSRLPKDVRVLYAESMAPDFHARKSASAKLYRYRFSTRTVIPPEEAPYVVRLPPRVDLPRLHRVTGLIVGRHDFSAFAKSGSGHRSPHRRILRAHWQRSHHELRLEIVGDGFLRGMVRALVGTLVDIGRGHTEPQTLQRLLEGRPRSEGGPNAPAQGLCLEQIFYPARWCSQAPEPPTPGRSTTL